MRNKSLEFTEAEVKYIKKILDDFAAIAKSMGINVTTEVLVTTNREAVELSYIAENGKMCQYHTKSVNWTWQHVVENIKSSFFGELRRMCS